MEDWAEVPLWNLGERLQMLPLPRFPAKKPFPLRHVQLFFHQRLASSSSPSSALGSRQPPGKSDVDQLQLCPFHCPGALSAGAGGGGGYTPQGIGLWGRIQNQLEGSR